MPNVTLPEKDGRGQQQGWLQVDKKVHQKMWQFGLKNPTGLAVLHFSPVGCTVEQTASS